MYHKRLDSRGVPQKAEEDRWLNEAENEEMDTRVNQLGHVFVNDRPFFFSHIANHKMTLQEELVRIAVATPPDKSFVNPILPEMYGLETQFHG